MNSDEYKNINRLYLTGVPRRYLQTKIYPYEVESYTELAWHDTALKSGFDMVISKRLCDFAKYPRCEDCKAYGWKGFCNCDN